MYTKVLSRHCLVLKSKQILNKTFKYLVLATLPSVMLACGGGSSGGGSNTTGLKLALTAPSMYPAGSPTSTNAMLTLNNISNESAVDLSFSIPSDLNTTGVKISVDGDKCKSIAAHSSCSFPVTIESNAHAGSFGVSVSNGGGLVGGLLSSVGLKASNTITLTANVGLTNVAPNDAAGADGITFLYNKVSAQNPDGATEVTVVAVVGSNAGAFDEIQLTDQYGSPLNYAAISGNSGSGMTNLSAGSIVTFIFKIPQGQTSGIFYATTKKNGSKLSTESFGNIITLSSVGKGILSLSTLNANLSHAPTESTSVTLTYTNIGTGIVNDIEVGKATAPIVIDSNNCPSSLSPASSCKVVLRSEAGVGVADIGSFTTSYGA